MSSIPAAVGTTVVAVGSQGRVAGSREVVVGIAGVAAALLLTDGLGWAAKVYTVMDVRVWYQSH